MAAPCTTDSETIEFNTIAGSPPSLTADVVVSGADANGLTVLPDGLYAVGGPPVVSSLPSSPADGAQIAFKVDDDTFWHLVFNAGVGLWKFLGGTPLRADVSTQETRNTGGTAYADLATVGPSVTLPSLDGDYRVVLGARFFFGDNAGALKMSASFGVAAVDADDVQGVGAAADNADLNRSYIKSITGGTVVTAKYANASGANAQFSKRYIEVTPRSVS